MRAASVRQAFRGVGAVAILLELGACAVGPNYSGPPKGNFPSTPDTYKIGDKSHRFTAARPADKEPRGPWWSIFHDLELDRLEKLALGANQDLRLASARIAESRAQSRQAAADFFPQAQFDGVAQRQRSTDRGQRQRAEFLGNLPFGSGATGGGTTTAPESSGGLVTVTQPRTLTQNLFRAPVDLNWELDLFGRVRRSYESARAQNQATVDDFNNMMLSVTANVASTYFSLRAEDAQIDVLASTINDRKESLQLATDRLDAGLTDQLDVSRARADLANTEANLFSLRASRGEMENSLATLLGQPASMVRIGHHPTPAHGSPPRVPAGLPSQMLQRRPDVAEAERNLAAANAQIGVEIAAFYPQIKLTGAAGFESADIGSLFVWPARFWQIGPSITLPIFQGGRNLANLRIAQARYEENVAQYRTKVLGAFQDVENALVDLRNLAGQARAEDEAVDAARLSLQLSQNRYGKGASTYLDVLDAQRTLLQYEQTSAHPDGRVLIFHIPSRPRGSAFHHDGRYLMRVGEELLPMSPDQLGRIFAENKPGFLEQIARSGVSAGDVIQLLDTQSYFDLFKLPYPAERAGVLERFINEDLIRPADGVYDITRLCALLFAKNLNDFGVEIARKAARTVLYRGPGKLETVRDTTGIKGYAVGFKGLISHIGTLLPSNEIVGEALRQTVRLYPSIAIRELVANALIHQDFEETGASVFIDIYSDRIEISNPGIPIVATERFIDGYRSRNERLADLMRRMNICEEKGSGVDKVIDAVEAHQLPAPDFRQTTNRTSVLLFAPVPFREMERLDRIRACYQHCCLRYVINQKMTNETLRQRFQLGEKQAETASRIIRETIREGRIKPENPDNASKRYMSYVPHWA